MTTNALPRTWRPLGTTVAAGAFGVLLVALTATVWIAWGPDIRSKFTTFQRATVVALGLMFLSVLYALMRSKVVARTDGLVVVNGYRTHRFDWAELIAVSLRRGAPFATVDLSDGSTLSLWGIQGSDGQRAIRAVRELRDVLTVQSRVDPGS